MFHDGTNSFVLNQTGNFTIKSKADEEAIKVVPDGAVEINHDGSKKFETTSGGATITGTFTTAFAGDGYSGGISAFVSGMIMLWSGTNAIPTGQYLCDGNNSTPDLRDRFVVGAGNSYSVGDNGGADSVTLTVSQMPSHTHTLDGRSGSYGSGQPFSAKGAKEPFWQNMTTDSTGGGQSHENRPPYYALCYIMKS